MPTDYVSRTVEAYDASPDKYIDTTRNLIMTTELESLVSLLPDNISPVLDEGCAYGKDCAWLADNGVSPVGIDLSEELLKRARLRHPGLHFEKMDVRHLNYPNNYFSGIWCNAVLLHLKDDDITLAVKEMHRVLKPRGAVAISFKEGSGGREIAEVTTSDKSRFYNFKQLDEVVHMLEPHGFKVQKSYGHNEQKQLNPGKRDVNWLWCFAIKRV